MTDYNPVQIANSEVSAPNYQEPLDNMVQSIRTKYSPETQDVFTSFLLITFSF